MLMRAAADSKAAAVLLREESESSEASEDRDKLEDEAALPRRCARGLGVPVASALGVSLLLTALLDSLLRPPAPGGHAEARGELDDERLRPYLRSAVAEPTRAQLVNAEPVRELTRRGVRLAGVVDAIYTYGAPAAAFPPLEDHTRADRCFRGLRSYTEDIIGPGAKQVDAEALSPDGGFPHPLMPVVALRWNADSAYAPCPNAETDWPGGAGNMAEWRRHGEKDYRLRLQQVKINGTPAASNEPFATASSFAALAFKAYDTTDNTKQVLADGLPGWKVVARETRNQGSDSLYDEDPVTLVQSMESLDCVLVFAGANNQQNELNTAAKSYGTRYCGFSNIHTGYRNELWDITADLWPSRLSPKLSKCNKVSCIGHGFGGTLCELFAACANSGRQDDLDFQQQAWIKGLPEAMPEIKADSTVLAQGASKRCDEPPCS